MQYIKKSSNPRALREWFEEQLNEDGEYINCRYDDFTREVKDEVVDALLKDQGFLCCYTGIRVSKNTCHIEHLKPQQISKIRKDHDDVRYKNLLAAYPKKSSCPFGARARENWYDISQFIHPLMEKCSQKFIFDEFGNIQPKNSKDEPTKTTIKKLRLDESSLVEMRKQAIDDVLLPLSRAQLTRIIENGYSVRDHKGRYPHFCFVIEQAAKQLLQKADRERKRQKAIRSQKSKTKRSKK